MNEGLLLKGIQEEPTLMKKILQQYLNEIEIEFFPLMVFLGGF